jgi:glycosyltransferase involved in cell wall biosynthesis
MARGSPVRAALLVKCLGFGGTERQLVELLRGLDPEQVVPRLALLMKMGEFLEPVRELGLDPPEFPLRGTLLQPNTAVQAVRLAMWLKREDAELLHCQDFYSNVVGSLAARLAGIPWIVSRRDLGAWTGPAHRQLLAAVTRSAPLVLCNSHAARDLVVEAEGVPPERIRVVPNGLNLDRFDRESHRTPDSLVPAPEPGAPIVILVANLKLSVKGHPGFLLAATQVYRVVPSARFLLVGDGERRPELERQAWALGIGRAVIFAGYRSDVPALLARSAVAVCSSKSEGLSNAIMEAMAAGLPVVATDVGGNSELIREGENGFLVPCGDAGRMASRIIELLRTPGLAARMGQAGRRRIEADFSSQRLSDRVTALYEEIAAWREGRGVIAPGAPARTVSTRWSDARAAAGGDSWTTAS